MGRTVASHPARVRVEIGRLLKCDGKDLIVLGLTVVIAGVIAPFNWQVALVLFGAGVFVVLSSLLQTKNLFMEGDVCPAVIIDAERQLVAVSTDLSKGGSRKMALKVLKLPLRRTLHCEVKKGQRLGYVAFYSGQPGGRVWTNFGGHLLDAGTSDRKQVQQVVAEISDQEWQSLTGAVRLLEKPYTTGFYDIKSGRLDGTELVTRPSPFRVRPLYAIAGGIVLVPVLGVVGLALVPKLLPRGGGNAPPANPPIIADANPNHGNGVPEVHVAAPKPGPGGMPPGLRPGEPPPERVHEQRRRFEEQRRRAEREQGQNPTNARGNDPTAAGDEGENPFQKKPLPENAKTVPDDDNPFRPVTGRTSAGWSAGQKAEANWNGSWLPVTILKVNPNGTIRIHWDGYSDNWDEDITADKLRTR